LNVGRPDTKVELFDWEKGSVEEVVMESDEWDKLPVSAHNIARMYETFRKREWLPGFRWTVMKRHEMIVEMWRRYDMGQMAH
jgi:hypothetical protein